MKELICIVCPKGCHLKVDIENNYKVYGNSCKRGEKYGYDELNMPMRVVTSTVKVKGGTHKRLPVMTKGAIPKELNLKCMEIINSIEVESPVKCGDVIVKNILGTGVNLVATRNI